MKEERRTSFLTILIVVSICVFSLNSSILADTDNTYVSLSNYASLSSALSSIGSNQRVLLIDRNETVNSNTTIPANVSLKFTRPYLLTISSGAELTISSSVAAKPVQIFSGDGEVSFSNSNAVSSFSSLVLQWRRRLDRCYPGCN